MTHRLSPREAEFARIVPTAPTPAAAARQAGYVDYRVAAIRLMQRPRVLEAIEERRAHLRETFHIDDQMILRELSLIGFADLSSFINGEGEVDLSNCSRDEFAALSALDTTTITAPDGRKKTTAKIKLNDKLKALEMLGRATGMFKAPEEMIGPEKFTFTLNLGTLKPDRDLEEIKTIDNEVPNE